MGSGWVGECERCWIPFEANMGRAWEQLDVHQISLGRERKLNEDRAPHLELLLIIPLVHLERLFDFLRNKDTDVTGALWARADVSGWVRGWV